MYQQTIGARIAFEGVGVHSGCLVSLCLLPAEDNTGVVFQRFDGKQVHEIKAVTWNAAPVELATVVGNSAGVQVATIEHLMAALYAMEIDNVIVQLDGDEIPILDGCAAAFVEAIAAVGTTVQDTKRQYLRVLKPVRVETETGYAEYRPYAGSRFEIEIDFANSAIGHQSYACDLAPALFRNELAGARTFGFMADVERLWAAGRALGSSLDNSVVVGHDGRVINPDGLRFTDEFVRHKALDAIGDQALAGARILGCYRSFRGGHMMNATALRALLADATAYEVTELPLARRKTVRHALPVAAAAPMFGPPTL
ncbi:UDP-3-O-acyl-N-acetylglucosamine deacetylase [Consotaella aegiceratis]|uniref:UDP-3-O-acyl-N-acetylglucosamine deacetylase n=1 Tax=Consotaella aegiceratis TaxID=3097961 RepID=UPI002F3F321A